MSRSLASVNTKALNAAKILARRSVPPDAWSSSYTAGYAKASVDGSADREIDRLRKVSADARLSPIRAQRVMDAKQRLEAAYASRPPTAKGVSWVSWLWHAQKSADAQQAVDAKRLITATGSNEYREKAIKQNKEVRAAVAERAKNGFVYEGGCLGGNLEYTREAFAFHGLVSNSHALFKLFVSKLPRGRHLNAGDDKAEVELQMSKLLGCDKLYIESNKSMVGVIRIELDAVVIELEILELCEAAGVHPPNFCIGWENGCGGIFNPHLVWLLNDSLPVKGKKNAKFHGLTRRVGRGLVKAFLSLGADPGGMLNFHKHKNPLCPLWNVRILSQKPFELADIAATVDTATAAKDLKAQHAAVHPVRARVPDHPDPVIAVSSNRLFAQLAEWAWSAAAPFKSVGDIDGFRNAVDDQALEIADSMISMHTDETETKALSVAATVARWTWINYRAPAEPKAKLTPEQVSARKSGGALRAAARRRENNKRFIVWTALKLSEKIGRRPKQKEVLAAAKPRIGSDNTVRAHWPAVLEALEKNAVRCTNVKKSELHSDLPSLSLLSSHAAIKCEVIGPNAGSPAKAIRATVPAFMRASRKARTSAPKAPEPFVHALEEATGPSVALHPILPSAIPVQPAIAIVAVASTDAVPPQQATRAHEGHDWHSVSFPNPSPSSTPCRSTNGIDGYNADCEPALIEAVGSLGADAIPDGAVPW